MSNLGIVSVALSRVPGGNGPGLPLPPAQPETPAAGDGDFYDHDVKNRTCALAPCSPSTRMSGGAA